MGMGRISEQEWGIWEGRMYSMKQEGKHGRVLVSRTLCRREYLGDTLQGKSHLCISFLGIARPQSQFPHSCACERFIYSQDWYT